MCLPRTFLLAVLVVWAVAFTVDGRPEDLNGLPGEPPASASLPNCCSCPFLPAQPPSPPSPPPLPPSPQQQQQQQQHQRLLQLESSNPHHSSCTRSRTLVCSVGKGHPSTGAVSLTPPPPPPPSSRLAARFSTNRTIAPYKPVVRIRCPNKRLSGPRLDHTKDILRNKNNMPFLTPPSLPSHTHRRQQFTDGASNHDNKPPSAASSHGSRPHLPRAASSAYTRRFPEPIVYQFTLYYPGNMPLVITAGHGGSAAPGQSVSRKVTHRFKRVPNLRSTSTRLDISSFSDPVMVKKSRVAQNNAELNDAGEQETMPWMPPRDQSKGGNFKKDLNTHAMALNLANAVACLSGSGQFTMAHRRKLGGEQSSHHHNDVMDHDHKIGNAAAQKNIPERCKAQGPWGDDDSDYPFSPLPSFTSMMLSTPTTTASTTNTKPMYMPTLEHEDPSSVSPVQNYPHVVVFRVPRLYVDVNRNISGENAIADHPVSKAAWNEYHDLIDHVQHLAQQQQQQQQQQLSVHPEVMSNGMQTAKTDISQPATWSSTKAPLAKSSPGLLLDIHGHVHTTNLIEIGYLLNSSVLAMEDSRLSSETDALAHQSSIRSLVSRVVLSNSSSGHVVQESQVQDREGYEQHLHQRPHQDRDLCSEEVRMDSPLDRVPLAALLRGWNESLGGMFQTHGLDAVPSPKHKAPCQGCIFFFGGYTIQRHGSRDQLSGSMDAIQLELPRILRIVGKEEGREIGMRLAKAVVEYMTRYYGIDFQRCTRTPLSVNHRVEKKMNEDAAGSFESSSLNRQRQTSSLLGREQRLQQQQQQQHPSPRPFAELGENHCGDSDIDDGVMSDDSDTGSSALRRPEMKRQSSRL
ncbi:hypothetical protein EDD11_008405 [Mortierella claussenii]|nr:hypothetical protein EDD11_008405 [Mortierella claussenii]